MSKRSPFAPVSCYAAGCTAVGIAFCLAGCLDLKGGRSPLPPDVVSPRALGPQPVFGPTVTQRRAPPPLSGGTLLIAGGAALVADPERDRLVLVDLARQAVRATLALQVGDEPGRAVADGAGNLHVVLRGGGAIVDVNPAGQVMGRRAVCPAPRGIAFDAARGDLVVACAGGEVVTLAAAGGGIRASARLERDLRDVVIDAADGRVLVSTLRSAKVFRLAADLSVAEVLQPSPVGVGEQVQFAPGVAWRMTALPEGGALLSHQAAADAPVKTTAGGYGGGGAASVCEPGIVHSAVTVIGQGSASSSAHVVFGAVLPVDVAVSPTREVAVIAAGNALIPGAAQVFTSDVNTFVDASHLTTCVFAGIRTLDGAAQAVAAAYDDAGALWVQTREPATLQRASGGPGAVTVDLGGESRADTGWAVFHSNSGAGLACASCHPEGSDDAHTWSFEDLGPRRTQSLRGGISGRAPFHWSGDEATFPALVGDVFVGRMSGPDLASDQVAALSGWLDSIPRLPASAPADAAAVARGGALFHDADVGCATCHAGPSLTTNLRVEVGTAGGPFKIPSLVNVAARAPYMHDGCAPTLADRFGPCGGGERHGRTAALSASDRAALVAYLETL